MRFLADENISNRVISGLLADGHDVLSIRSGHAGLECFREKCARFSRQEARQNKELGSFLDSKKSGTTLDDPAVLGIAEAGNRILITEDHDFGELVIRQKLPVVGVVLLELDPLSNVAEAARIRAVVASEGNTRVGHLTVVEPGRLRRRALR